MYAIRSYYGPRASYERLDDNRGAEHQAKRARHAGEEANNDPSSEGLCSGAGSGGAGADDHTG